MVRPSRSLDRGDRARRHAEQHEPLARRLGQRRVAGAADRKEFSLRAAPFRHQQVGKRCPCPDDVARCARIDALDEARSEEHTSELQSLMRISYAVFCLKKKKNTPT